MAKHQKKLTAVQKRARKAAKAGATKEISEGVHEWQTGESKTATHY